MITGYKQLTGKYLKASKKRTILTVIGIVLSVALITTIGLFIVGMQAVEVDSMKSNFGSWQLQFSKIDGSTIDKIVNNPRVLKSGLLSEGKEIQVSKDLKVAEITATDKALELLPYKAKTGRMPQNDKEAALEKWTLWEIDSNAKIGDKIKLNNKEYTLVGILEDKVETQFNNDGVLLTKSNSIDKSNATLLVQINPKSNLKKSLNQLKQAAGNSKIVENVYLLGFQGAGGRGSSFNALFAIAAIVIGIVAVATIAVIYNSFQISVVERIKQFGLLRAVGAAPKQIRRLILREATLLAAIGIPIGLLCGIIANYSIYLVFGIIGGSSVNSQIMRPVLSTNVFAASAIVGLVSIYVSAFIPALFAGKISPLTAISSRTAITKEKIKRRKNVIAQKIFGFEGALASKNIKRNRKRYRITVFSIAISVMLFVTFKSFMDMTMTINSGTNESNDIHFTVTADAMKYNEQIISNNIFESIKSLKTVNKVYKVYNLMSFNSAINSNSEINSIKAMKAGTVYNGKINFDGSEKTLINSGVEIYDQASLERAKKYLKAGSINEEQMNKENGVILINKNSVYDTATKKTYKGPVVNMKVGDEIELQYAGDEENAKTEFGKGIVKKVKVLAILQSDSFDYLTMDENQLKLITTEEVAKTLIDKKDIMPSKLNISIKDVKDEQTAKSEIGNVISSDSHLSVMDEIDNNRNIKSSKLMIEILIYGFVVVVSLIGSVNIVNTITTNILLRKREFASLKSIGLTQRGLRKMIVLEGILYGVAGTIYGSIIGSGFSYLLYKQMGDLREFNWHLPWTAIGIAAICAIVIGYISVLSPLTRIKKENLIEIIREDA